MERITAQKFFKSWLIAVEEKKETLKAVWQQPQKFTSAIRGWKEDTEDYQESIVSMVAQKIELECYPQDYYCIDTVFYNKEKDLVPESPKNSYWFRNIRVAFEHENVFNSKLYEEISHLLITTCELRVLVAYPPESLKTWQSSIHFLN